MKGRTELVVLLLLGAICLRYPSGFALILVILTTSFGGTVVELLINGLLGLLQAVIALVVMRWTLMPTYLQLFNNEDQVTQLRRERPESQLPESTVDQHVVTESPTSLGSANQDTTVDRIKDFELNQPSRGTSNWGNLVNENFSRLENTISYLGSRLDVPVKAAYYQPEPGEAKWHKPLNRNFEFLSEDIQRLAQEAGVQKEGEYVQPEPGTTNWHIQFNNNFSSLQQDLRAIEESI